LDDIGVEGISYIDTSLVQNVPVIDVREGSILDKTLPNIVTIYPIGVFTNDPLTKWYQEEEGFHWQDQQNWGIFLPFWYQMYVNQYIWNTMVNIGNTTKAHDAVSFEKSAWDYAKKYFR
jgi:hypothetical protein